MLEQPDSVHAHRALYFAAILGRDAPRAEVAKQRVVARYDQAGERATGEAIPLSSMSRLICRICPDSRQCGTLIL